MHFTLRGLQSLSLLLTLLLFLLLSFYIGHQWSQRYLAYQAAEEQLNLLHQLERLSNTLATERGLHAAHRYRHTLPPQTYTKLNRMRERACLQTDTIVQKLRALIPESLPPELVPAWKNLNGSLTNVSSLRKKDKAFAAYTELIHELITFQQQLVLYLPDPHLQKDAQSLIDLILTREQAGQERGMIMHALIDKRLNARRYFEIAGHISQQELFLENFMPKARPKLAQTLEAQLSTPSMQPIYALRTHLRTLFDLQQHINSLLEQIGYTGFIHNYKNYLLRNKNRYFDKAQIDYAQSITTLYHIKTRIPLLPAQREAVEIIEGTLRDYYRNLLRIQTLHQKGVPLTEIDRQVKVNDHPARQAIRTLQTLLTQFTTEQWWALSSQRIQLFTQTAGELLHHMQEVLTENQNSLLKELMYIFTLLTLMLALLLLISAYSVTRMQRLRDLVGQLSGMVKRHDYAPLPEQGQDEVAQLVQTFNALINERQDHVESIWRQSNLDALTQLPNRTYLLDLLSYALHNAHREGEKVAVLFIDLDGFKQINDTEGHRAGDELLQIIANRLRNLVRENDLVARLGGDEFVVVLPHVSDESEVAPVARKIIDAINQPIELENGKHVQVSASIGITLYPDDGDSVDTLMMNADMAMYRAKERGKNQAARFQHDWSRRLLRQQQLQTSLTDAAESGSFAQAGLKVVYQPIIDLTSGQVSHMEALLRWEHPELGPLSPLEFIPVAEHSLTSSPYLNGSSVQG